MLDLNLDAFSGAGKSPSGDITVAVKAKSHREDSRTVTEEDSGTSCSSVIIAGEETTSTGGGSFISFDILRKDPQKEGENPSPAVSQYSTFPAAGEKGFFSFGSGEGQKWLQLSPWNTSDQVLKFGNTNTNNNNSNNHHHHRITRKSRRGPRSRSSPYRGVTFYRRTGRWESHIWDCGKQVYLGGFDTAHTAARAYDRAAIKFRGLDADINFEASDYEEDIKLTKNLTKEEFVQLLRRQTNAAGGCGSRNRVGGGGGGNYKSGMPLDAKTSTLLARNKICNTRDNNTAGHIIMSGVQANVRGVRATFGSNVEDKGQNLELTLGVSPSASREGKFPQRVGSNGDLSSYSMAFATKQNPAVFSGIYSPHRLMINHQQLGIVEKKVEEISPLLCHETSFSNRSSSRSIIHHQGNNNNNNFVLNGVCAASSRFSSSSNSSYSSSTGQLVDSSSSLDLSLKPNHSSNLLCSLASLSSTTRNVD